MRSIDVPIGPAGSSLVEPIAVTSAPPAASTARDAADLHAFVISRRQDVQRRRHFFSHFPHHVLEVSVVDAVDGSKPDFDPADYATVYRGHWRGRRNIPHGSFAISLSHLKAWHRILEMNLARAFIFEDDAVVSPLIAHAIAEWPRDVDLLFVNHRIDTWTFGLADGRSSPVADAGQGFGKWLVRRLLGRPVDRSTFEEHRRRAPIPVRRTVANMIRSGHKPGRDVAWAGSEGYGLSRRGAQRLVDFIEQKGVVIDVDFFLIAAGLGREDFAGAETSKDKSFDQMRELCEEAPIVGAALSGRPCVAIAPQAVGGSVKSR